MRPFSWWSGLSQQRRMLVAVVALVVVAGAANVPLQSVCPRVSIGHGQLPTAPLVFGIVLRTLHSAALSPPRASDCRSLQALGGGSGG